MSDSAYAAGVVSLVCVIGPWMIAAPLVRAVLLPATRGAQARLVEIVLAVSGLTITTEVVGSFGGFHRWTLAGVHLVVGAGVALLAARRIGPRPARPPRATPRLRPMLLIPAGAVFASTAQWLAGAISAYRTGIVQVESLHYHLSHAAFFVNTGTLWRPHEVSAGSDAAFHPLNIELLHALGMVTLHDDVLSLFINVLCLWLLFLAAWCAGERVGAGAASVTAVALLSVALPMGGSAGGTALNDVGVVAFVLAAVGVMGEIGREGGEDRFDADWRARLIVGGLALGLAIGAKLTAPGAALGLAVGWLWAGRRFGWRRSAVALVVPMLLTGSFWYLRDWWFFGSPLPTLGTRVLGIGHTAVPLPALTGVSFDVAHYLTNAHVIRHWYLVALHADFGRVWPVTSLLPLLGVLLVLRRGRSTEDRVLAFAATVGFIVFLFTPLGALGPPGKPVLFGSNVRYAMPCMSLGLLVLVRHPRLAKTWWTSLVLFVLELVTLSARGMWPTNSPTRGTEAALICLAVAAVLVIAWRRAPKVLAGALVVGVVAVAVVGLPLTRHFEKHRYAAGGTGFVPLFRWASGLHDARIGFVGFPASYPLYGPSFTNSVAYIGQHAPHHAFNDFSRCAPYAAAVNAARVQYVVVLNQPGDAQKWSRFVTWTGRTEGPSLFQNQAFAIFKITHPLSAAGCTGVAALS